MPPRDHRAPTVTVERAAGPAPLGAIVRVVGATATPRQLALRAGTCRIGAAPDVDMLIEDETVSRQHVELELVPEGVAVRDLGSRNGTFYLGQRVHTMVLALGSSIALGKAEVRIDADLAALDKGAADAPARYADLVGVSPAMQRLFAALARLEGSLVNVLVEGESGTGKELIVRALHDRSRLAKAPFVAINCGELDRQLARSELFGHRKGAFTGAIDARGGAFEAADGGTLFLDEVGELPLDVQPVLLRALETGTVVRVGESTARPVKVRVIAATNRGLDDEVKQGRFRSDLFYRLNVVRLTVPPLRERPADIDALAIHFAEQAGIGALPRDVLAHLRAQPWPGNARELKNAILAYGALGTLGSVARDGNANALEAAIRGVIDPAMPYDAQKEHVTTLFTRLYLEKLLEHTKGNQSEAARVSGLERSYLGKLVSKLGIAKRD